MAVTVITIEEQLSGWYSELRRTRRASRLAQIYQRIADTIRFLSRLRIVTFSERAIGIYDTLRSLKLNIGPMDLRIAAIALEQNACLVTRNTRDFERVPGLRLEDWTS